MMVITLLAMLVSIHAPVKGRRQASGKDRQAISFNPRPREGATAVTGGVQGGLAFQSTPP